MSFTIEECAIPTVWCGNRRRPEGIRNNSYYTRNGTRYECLRKGIGIGKYGNRNLPEDSLQNIKYIGQTYDSKFSNEGITGIRSLKSHCRRESTSNTRNLLLRVFRKTSGGLDTRAYNSTIHYLYVNGCTKVPRCIRMA